MVIDRRTFVAAPLGTVALAGVASAALAPEELIPTPARPDATIRLWPGEAPGLTDRTLDDHVTVRGTDPAFPDRAIDRVRTPRLDVFRPANPNGAAMLVIPGGGYIRIVYDKEGYELAPWFAARGITVFVLIYRLPGEGWRDRSDAPLADAQRAMRLIRANAAGYGVDPKRVGAMGFSAGGHLCADLATRFAREVYEPVDAADTLEARPMIAAPIYPVVSMDPAITHAISREKLLGPDPDEALAAAHSIDRLVTRETPPCFLCHSEDDRTVPVANTLRLHEALRAANVPTETHLFQSGDHGFGWGLRTRGKTVHVWPELWLAWAREHGLLG